MLLLANRLYKKIHKIPYALLCPTEEDLGMLMSSVVINAPMCGQEGEKEGTGARQGEYKWAG